VLLRSAQARHKMCPSCRALVPRAAGRCPDCGESLHAVRVPGPSRLMANLLPGMTAASSVVMFANGIVFLLMMMAQMHSGESTGSLMRSFDPELIVRFGSGLSRPRALPDGTVTGGEWWRLITAMFLHGGLLHFFFNSYLLIRLGPMVEAFYGPARFWVIYLACGVAGNAASQIPFFKNTVGASGAIMGLIGLLLAYGWRYRSAEVRQMMTSLLTQLLLFWMIFWLMSPRLVDHFNHLGGFLAGGLLTFLIPAREFRSRAELVAWQLLALAGVLLVLFAFLQVTRIPRGG
jgi:rhomboid protease GluP